MTSKNIAILNDFIHYCIAHPEERFWQALRNWSGFKGIFVCNCSPDEADSGTIYDTFYFEEKDK
jgi:hypothetical protein